MCSGGHWKQFSNAFQMSNIILYFEEKEEKYQYFMAETKSILSGAVNLGPVVQNLTKVLANVTLTFLS